MCVQNTDKNIRKFVVRYALMICEGKGQNSDSDDFENDQYAKELCIL